MGQTSICLIESLIALPFFSALLLLVAHSFGCKGASGCKGQFARNVGVVTSLLQVILCSLLILSPDGLSGQLKVATLLRWLPQYGVNIAIGSDGFSQILVLVTSILFAAAFLIADLSRKNISSYATQLLILQSAIVGVLFSADLFLFYIFWELMLIPIYFLIGVFGGERRTQASVLFVIYTLAGSVLMLLAIIYIGLIHYQQVGNYSFLITDLLHRVSLSVEEEKILFLAFALAFAVKIPVFPFHGWLAETYEQAPTGVVVILSGIVGKLGIFGLIRFGLPLFPRAAEHYGSIGATLAVVSIIYGAFAAWGQRDIRRLLAYSSFSHLGFCFLGLCSATEIATSGLIFLLVAHAATAAGLFVLAGALVDRIGSGDLTRLGGLARTSPWYAAIFAFLMFGSVAVPLTAGFIGEFLILTGSFAIFKVHVAIALLGVILGAVYMLSAYRRAFFGEPVITSVKLEVSSSVRYVVVPFVLVTFVLGMFPQIVLGPLASSVKGIIRQRSERLEYLSSRAGKSNSPSENSQDGERGAPSSGALLSTTSPNVMTSLRNVDGREGI